MMYCMQVNLASRDICSECMSAIPFNLRTKMLNYEPHLFPAANVLYIFNQSLPQRL